MSFKVVIPARYASTRLPAKPLLDIAGLPMVVRVAQQAAKSGASEIVIATDHHEIMQAVEAHGFKAMMTRLDHVSGTDRIAEVALTMGWSDDVIVVNVQGDEPLIEPLLIAQVAENLSQNLNAVMSSACHAMHDPIAFINPNVVKVVLDIHQHALYFSRAPIPYPRADFSAGLPIVSEMDVYRHIGIYAYRVGFLSNYANLSVPMIEKMESLEQLRVLNHGYKISMLVTENAPASGVDTQEDLEYVRTVFK